MESKKITNGSIYEKGKKLSYSNFIDIKYQLYFYTFAQI